MDTVKQIIVISRGLSEARDARSINNGEVAENSKAMGNDRDRKVWEGIGIPTISYSERR